MIKKIYLCSLFLIPAISSAHNIKCDLHVGLTAENVDFKNSKGDTALFLSVTRYRVAEFARREREKNPDSKGVADSPENCLRSIEKLLQLGADPNLQRGNREDRGDWTPFHNSYRMGVFSEPILDLLLKYGADINSYDGGVGSGFWSRLDELNERSLDKYLSKGADPNLPTSNRFSNYPIEILIRDNEKNKVQVLLKHGANPDHVSSRGTPIIVRAAASNKVEIVLMLIESGANINAQNKQGFTALHYAAITNHDLYKKLIDLGADDTIASKSGKRPWELLENPIK